MTRRVILVAGPPCAGKTTYAHDHAVDGDLILDQDELGPATFADAVDQVAAMENGTAYVIRCCGGASARAAFAEKIRATETVLLVPPTAVLMSRAKQRTDPSRHVKAIRYWLDQEDGRNTPDPQPSPRTRW